jgi:hypothetical protein
MREPMLTWALRYRAHAFSPIPFLNGRKKPALKKGVIARYRKTPASSAQLREWFEQTDHQVGFITGAYPYPLVLDIDGDEGRQSIKGLSMPPTPMVETSDGFHAYFRTKTPIQTRIKALPGVDILGLNWQVLAPPSLHPNGHRYHFHDLLSSPMSNSSNHRHGSATLHNPLAPSLSHPPHPQTIKTATPKKTKILKAGARAIY